MTALMTALFNTVPEAQRAIQDAARLDISRASVSVVGALVGNEAPDGAPNRLRGAGPFAAMTAPTVSPAAAPEAAVPWGGLDFVTLPDVGPVVTAGPIADALRGSGGRIAGIAHDLAYSLGKLGMAAEDAHLVVEAVREGATLVMVPFTDEAEARDIADVLQDSNGRSLRSFVSFVAEAPRPGRTVQA